MRSLAFYLFCLAPLIVSAMCDYSPLVGDTLAQQGLVAHSPRPAPERGMGVSRIALTDTNGNEFGHVYYSRHEPDGIKINHYELSPALRGSKLSTLLLQLALDQVPDAKHVFAELDQTNQDAFLSHGVTGTPIGKSLKALGFTQQTSLGPVKFGGKTYPGFRAELPPGGSRVPLSDQALREVGGALKPEAKSSEVLRSKFRQEFYKTDETDLGDGKREVSFTGFSLNGFASYSYEPVTGVLTLTSVYARNPGRPASPVSEEIVLGMMQKILDGQPRVSAVRMFLNDQEVNQGDLGEKKRQMQMLGYTSATVGERAPNQYRVPFTEYLFRQAP